LKTKQKIREKKLVKTEMDDDEKRKQPTTKQKEKTL